MKGCFVLQRRFLYIGHELAILLRERGVVQEFCAYVQLREGRDFLEAQKDIGYTSIILDEDLFKLARSATLDYEYLRRLESEYGVLWRYINVDRVIRLGQLVREYPFDTSPHSCEDILRLVQTYACRIENFLDEEKPDFVYMFQPGALGTLLLYEMARKRGIPVFTTLLPSMRDLVIVSERYDTMTGVEDQYTENLKKKIEQIPKYQEAREFIEEFRKKPFVYSDVVVSREKKGKWKQFDFLLPQNLYRTISYNFFQIFVDWLKNANKRTDYTTVNPFLHLYDRVRRKARNFVGLADLYDEFDRSKPFVFFPLQFEPEMSILLNAPFDSDQIQIARRLAQSLPVGMYLYVKEHPLMVPYRPRRYYKELKRISNVRLIDPAISGFDLIRSGVLTANIGSSAGWEATILGKPVITFGDAFYNVLPSVARSRTPEELPALVRESLKKGGCPDTELTCFIAALLQDGAQVDLMHLWEIEGDRAKKRQGLTALAEVLTRKISSL